MFTNSKVKQAAWKFLDFLFTKDAAAGIQQERGLPADHDRRSPPTRIFADNQRLKVFVDLLPTAHFAPTVTGWEDTAKAVTRRRAIGVSGQRDSRQRR